MQTNTNNKFFMAGTEGTGEYVVLLITELGRVGYRQLGGSKRIRVEPAGVTAVSALKSAFPAPAWKQPGQGGEFRFSTVATDMGATEALTKAAKALLDGAQSVEINPDLEPWAAGLMANCGKAVAKQAASDAEGDDDTGSEPAAPVSDERTRLMAEARTLKIRGANSRWSLETLRRKIADAKSK